MVLSANETSLATMKLSPSPTPPYFTGSIENVLRIGFAYYGRNGIVLVPATMTEAVGGECTVQQRGVHVSNLCRKE
jgi:hypothetical protein